jgi:hypothetical protein
MKEACFCGRVGETEDRDPILKDDGQTALRWPECGHLDDLLWLSADARRRVFENAGRDRNVQPLPAA